MSSEDRPNNAAKLRLRRFSALAASVLALGAVAPVAQAAQDPTAAQYDDGTQDVGGKSSGGSSSGSGTAGTQASGGESDSGLGSRVGGLPFTGWDLISLASIAVALLAAGMVLQRLTRSPKH